MKNKLHNLLAICLIPALASCGGDEPSDGSDTTPDNSNSEVEDVKSVTSNLVFELSTDKAVYSPGEVVKFTCSSSVDGYKIRYRHGADVIAEQDGSGTSWSWTPPTTDFTGYMIDIYKSTSTKETIAGTIAVDVSSDWTKFPRYGFVATFDKSKLATNVIENEMAFLSRCHINGVQFQDWHNKHHWPLGGTRGNLLDTYKDIANREISTEVIKKYISVQHSLGMKSIFYNLCYGALDDAATDGVKESWYAFKDAQHGDKDAHVLSSSWKSNIYVLDPSNAEWLDYIAERNDEVYSSFDFDGYQIDQLGNRGTRYTYNGSTINMPQGFATFINKMKQRHPNKRLIMNAVSSYGASQIVGTGNVDFCYNEVWASESKFQDLYTIIKANDNYSNHTLKTVFAAYMNYDYANTYLGEMNTPGVVMTDAVMMALGGSHLELGGDHMLSREYFPASPLTMNEELKVAMTRYYDFMTAYENLLRGASSQAETTVKISCTDSSKKVTFSSWPPQQRTVTTYAKEVDGKTVLHLLNFINIDDLSWRDLNCTRTIPQLKANFPVSISTGKSVKKVWMASPDQHGGVAQELAFTYANGTLSFTIPSLRYWDMIVIE